MLISGFVNRKFADIVHAWAYMQQLHTFELSEKHGISDEEPLLCS